MYEIDVNAYLARLGLNRPDAPGFQTPSIEALRILHRAHVERVPYENLDIQLGRPTTISPSDSAQRIVAQRRGGYCYHLNGGFALLLARLGYGVHWHRGGVQSRDQGRSPGANGNHLALSVHGLPARENPDGMWFVDVGLGDALWEPLPLRPGTYRDGPFMFTITPSNAEFLGWRFEHDVSGSFTAMDFRAEVATQAEFQAMHEHLSSSPESPFVRVAAAMRRDAEGVYVLRGRVLRRLPSGQEWQLSTQRDWYGALADVFGLTLDDVPDDEKASLWRRVNAAHEAWQTA